MIRVGTVRHGGPDDARSGSVAAGRQRQDATGHSTRRSHWTLSDGSRLERSVDQSKCLERIASGPEINHWTAIWTIPINGRAVHPRRGRRLEALDDLIVTSGVKVAHVVAVEHIQDPLFPSRHDQIGPRYEQRALSAKV